MTMQTAVDTESTALWEGRYASNYHEEVQEHLLAKVHFDDKIAEKAKIYLREGDKFVEYCCGPAPIGNRLLRSESCVTCIGVDFSTEMVAAMGDDVHLVTTDLADPFGISLGEEVLADSGSLINGWYAITVPDIEGESCTKEEALFLRKCSLDNIASTMRTGGTLILSDPLASARDIGIREICKNVDREYNYHLANGSDGNKGIALLDTAKKLFSRATINLIATNKKITEKAHLFESIEEMRLFIESSGNWEIIEEQNADYVGHSATFILRRTEKPVISSQLKIKKGVKLEANGTFLTRPKNRSILQMLAKLRKRSYEHGDVNAAVEGIDMWDRLRLGRTAIVTAMNSPHILGAMRLLFNKEAKEAGVVLEIEELLRAKDGKSVIATIADVLKTDEDSIAEIGKLVFDPKVLKMMENANGGLRATLEVARLVIDGVTESLMKEMIENNVRYAIFITTPGKANLFARSMVSGLDLKVLDTQNLEVDRLHPIVQRVMIEGLPYFYEEDELKNVFDEKDLNHLKAFQKILTDRPQKRSLDDCIALYADQVFSGVSWSEAVGLLHKLVDKLQQVHDGVRVYYIDTKNYQD